MNVIRKVIDWRKKRKIERLIAERNPLHTLEFHALYTNLHLRKRKDIDIGKYTYGAPVVRSGGGIAHLKIGNFCCIGPDVSIHLISDHHPDWITSYDIKTLFDWGHHVYTKDEIVYKGDVTIGNDVWIGERAIILPGVSIGDGCVIGAGSIVTKSIEPYTIAAGNPCKPIRKRFSEEDISLLKEVKWWDWNDNLIYEQADLLQQQNVKKLYQFYCEHIKQRSK